MEDLINIVAEILDGGTLWWRMNAVEGGATIPEGVTSIVSYCRSKGITSEKFRELAKTKRDKNLQSLLNQLQEPIETPEREEPSA